MRRRLVSYYFGPTTEEGQCWDRMAAVLRRTAQIHCPGWDLEIEKLDPPPAGPRLPQYRANDHKLAAWCRSVEAAPAGAEIVLADADTFINGSLDPIFEQPFDFAYTRRRAGAMYPFNAGVIALRVSPKVVEFMQRWCIEDRKMLADVDYHRRWAAKYGGINQASLGKLLEEPAVHARHHFRRCLPEHLGLQVEILPCEVWNCENTTWAAFDPERTRIVHIKSALRRRIFGSPVTTTGVERLALLWHQLEAAARA